MAIAGQPYVQLKPIQRHLQPLPPHALDSKPPVMQRRWRWVYVYVALIPLVNWGFFHIPGVLMPDGGHWYPMAIVTGLILVFRDFAQREVEHYIIIPLLIGIGLSYLMAPPEVALASGIAFAVSEMLDYFIYTVSNRPFSGRVMISTTISSPIDSIAFLSIANMAIPGVFAISTLITSVLSKLAGAYIVYRIVRRRERKAAA